MGFWDGVRAVVPGARPAPVPGVAAQVARGPAQVQVYHPDGASALVRAEDVGDWLGRGFRLTRVDLPAEAGDLRARLDAGERALRALVREIEIDGEYHPATLAAAEVAAGEVSRAMARILADAQLAYGPQEAAPVVLRDLEGLEHRVDPGQVAEYRRRGWREVQA